jgi:hypothetical protein
MKYLIVKFKTKKRILNKKICHKVMFFKLYLSNNNQLSINKINKI